MTMPKFEQAKEDWLSHDDWQYADRDACWKFFYSAGQSDGKAIPMKYRRMEFNAQLQAELAAAREEIEKLKDCFAIEGGKVDVLEQLLTQSREEIKTLQANLRMAKWERAEVELIEQLATSQADNERLREALSLVESVYRLNVVEEGEPSSVLEAIQKALSTQPDHSALREHDKQLVERIAQVIQPEDSYQDDWFKAKADCYKRLMEIADKVRKGKF